MVLTKALLMFLGLLAISFQAVPHFLQTTPQERLATTILQLSILGTMCLTVLALSVLFVLRTWRRWNVRVQDVPVLSDDYAEITSVTLDPTRGLVANTVFKGEVIKTIINPQYWHLLPSCALSNREGLESAVLDNLLTTVKPEGEPASLVILMNEKVVVGMGSRVKYHGKSYLLTANHVWNGNSPQMYVCKRGKRVEIDLDAKIAFGCFNERVDFVMVEIPDAVWTSLGVKAALLIPMEKRSTVTIYGCDGASTSLLCASSRADKGVLSHDIEHGCTTTSGWSGSPLYSKGCVVGIHAGQLKLGSKNRGVNIAILLQNPTLETVFSEITNTLIDAEEASTRDYDFLEVDIIGRGRVAIGRGEYYIPRFEDSFVSMREQNADRQSLSMAEYERKYLSNSALGPWGLLESNHPPPSVSTHTELDAAGKREEGDCAEPAEEVEFFDSLETIPSHLNCERADGVRSCPPSLISDLMNGTTAKDSRKRECRSTSLEDRVSNLEKLVEKLLAEQSRRQLQPSPNLKSMVGLTEDRKQKCIPSSSKPVVSKERRPRKDSKKPALDLPRDIPVASPSPVCEAATGSNAKSRRQRRRSVKATSTTKPLPVSPSARLERRTALSSTPTSSSSVSPSPKG